MSKENAMSCVQFENFKIPTEVSKESALTLVTNPRTSLPASNAVEKAVNWVLENGGMPA